MDTVHGLPGHIYLLTLGAVKYGNGNPPGTLAGQTPIRPMLNHGIDTLPAP